MRIFGDVVASEVDGPGVRAVVHFAGCSIRCPGCFNKLLWEPEGPGTREISAEDLAAEILAVSPHVTISGGEPTDQPNALIDLLVELKRRGVQSVILFTGRSLQCHELMEALGVDVVVAGPFDPRFPEREWLCGSSNQILHVLRGSRIGLPQLRQHGVQVHLSWDRAIVTGFPCPEMLEDLQ